MRFFSSVPDGGKGSGVTAYFLCEIKPLFSIALLRFDLGTREALHDHAFNAVTIWLKGKIREHHLDGTTKDFAAGRVKFTKRETFHKVEALEKTWALSFRGPWVDRWHESRSGKIVTLTHGRKEIN